MGNLIYIQTDNNRVFTHKTNVCEFFKKKFLKLSLESSASFKNDLWTFLKKKRVKKPCKTRFLKWY